MPRQLIFKGENQVKKTILSIFLAGLFCTQLQAAGTAPAAPVNSAENKTTEQPKPISAEDATPSNVLKFFLTKVELGKSTLKDLDQLFSADGAKLKQLFAGEYLVFSPTFKSPIELTPPIVTLLGPNKTADSFTLEWDFKSREAFDKVKTEVENEIKKSLGLGARSESKQLFTNQQRFQNKDKIAFMTWSTYAEFLKVEVILQTPGENPKNLTNNVSEEIAALIKAFPNGKGSFSDVDKFGAEYGCLRADTTDPQWQTLRTKLKNSCGRLHFYFEVDDKNKSKFKSIRITPEDASETNNATYSKILNGLYGQPTEKKLPMFDRPSKVFQAGNANVTLSDLTLQDKPNVDISISHAAP